MSLRNRVALLILAIFMAGMLVTVARTWQDARRKLQLDLQSSQVLVSQLIALVPGVNPATPAQSLSPSQMERLAQLDDLRGFDMLAQAEHPRFASKAPASMAVPGWFVARLDIAPASLVRQVGVFNGQPVQVRVDLSDEIEDVWDNATQTAISLIGSWLLLNIVVYLMLGRWLRPIDQTIAGLQDLERGDYAHHIPPTGLPELDQINDKINELTDVLGASKQENERLQAEAISNQENERQRLARELHDSLGQSVSAIKAMAVSIGLRCRQSMPEIADSAQHIERTSELAYGTVRNMIAWLRPAALDELGLAMALQQMVDDWNVHHEQTFCRLRVQCSLEGLDDEQSINIYRIVQESLTNVAKHADARDVYIDIHGEQVLTLAIVDNGKGFDPDKIRRGMGLWNIQDRVNLLQGKLQTVASPGNGVSLYIEFPRHHDRREGKS